MACASHSGCEPISHFHSLCLYVTWLKANCPETTPPAPLPHSAEETPLRSSLPLSVSGSTGFTAVGGGRHPLVPAHRSWGGRGASWRSPPAAVGTSLSSGCWGLWQKRENHPCFLTLGLLYANTSRQRHFPVCCCPAPQVLLTFAVQEVLCSHQKPSSPE